MIFSTHILRSPLVLMIHVKISEANMTLRNRKIDNCYFNFFKGGYFRLFLVY